MALIYQNDEIAHFRHCALVKSMATNQGDMYLTTGVQSSYNLNGLLKCQAQQPALQHFWLWTDDAHLTGTDYANCGFIGSIFDPSISPQQWVRHVYTNSDTEGAVCLIDITSTSPQFATAERWAFICDDTMRNAFRIVKPGTQLCLTAGSSGSDTISSSSVTCYLTTYSSKKNQLWTLEASDEIVNPVQLAPVLSPSLAISSPGQSSQSMLDLAISAWTPDNRSAVWASEPSSYYTGSNPKILTKIFSPISPTGQWWNNYYSQSGVAIVMSQSGKPLYQDARINLGSTVNFIQHHYEWRDFTKPLTNRGFLQGGQYSIGANTSYAVSSSDGTLQIAGSPYAQPTLPGEPAEQFWLPAPRNFPDYTLPTPYDVRVSATRWGIGGETVELSAANMLQYDNWDLSVDFVCEWDAFLCYAKIRHKPLTSTYGHDLSGSWGEWEKIIEPRNGNMFFSSGEFLQPYAPAAWIPNAWSEPSEPGRNRLSTRLPLVSSCFEQGSLMELELTLQAFSYTDTHDRKFRDTPGLPLVGPAVTMRYLIATKPSALQFGYYENSYFSEPGLTLAFGIVSVNPDPTWRIRVTGIEFGSSQNRRKLLREQFEAPCVPTGDRDSLAVWPSEVTIPYRYLTTAATTEILNSLLDLGDGSTRTLTVDYEIVTDFGAAQPEAAQVDVQLPSGTTRLTTSEVIAARSGQFAMAYNAHTSSTWDIAAAIQKLVSERGPRWTDMSLFPSLDSAIARHMCGAYLGSGDETGLGIVFLRHTSTSALGIFIHESTSTYPIKVASLSYADSDGAVHIIPIEGNLSMGVGIRRDIAQVRRWGGKAFVAGATGGEAPTISFSGTIFTGQLYGVSRITNYMGMILIEQDIQSLYAIPADAVVMLRSTFGTAYMTKIVSIDTPRTSAGHVEVSIEFVEVE